MNNQDLRQRFTLISLNLIGVLLELETPGDGYEELP